MEASLIKIRVAALDDAPEILKIYAPYVEKTAISFEYTVPNPEEFQSRMARILERYPYLVAVRDGEILGYAYAGPFVGRAAYDWSAEATIYLREDCRRMGLGKKLYGALETLCRAQNLLNLNVCIGYPQKEDEYLTRNSVDYHAHLGYRLVGEFHHSGYKFGRWYSMVWMEKMLGEHGNCPVPVIPFPQLDPAVLQAAGISQV